MEHPCGPSRNLFRSVEPETVIAHASLVAQPKKANILQNLTFSKENLKNKEILVTRTDLVAKRIGSMINELPVFGKQAKMLIQ